MQDLELTYNAAVFFKTPMPHQAPQQPQRQHVIGQGAQLARIREAAQAQWRFTFYANAEPEKVTRQQRRRSEHTTHKEPGRIRVNKRALTVAREVLGVR